MTAATQCISSIVAQLRMTKKETLTVTSKRNYVLEDLNLHFKGITTIFVLKNQLYERTRNPPMPVRPTSGTPAV